ncbi:MAG: 2,3-dehydroadipyl-CoA hydratase [Deltaproteobacteria bacterium ADurb.BinA179]|jgi:enoyl-CoA hydratase|nr:enoyl-CoA hydratase [Deltaproteobacteria bacterium]MDI9542429.1 enoyl-CoA hydratase [Pseudomonadota bacterium]OPZ26086.1 MAG: 2,3-dehydroadipyl-CoA hydratase [Deltaproteobacteria bacterium ADurb.BinA179]HRT45660.1 enoyl-CoA hydratase [Desulfomonilia bacterium]HNU73956.1 enoyl-CoA hydratase [Deltaproteobacteria bacterium]
MEKTVLFTVEDSTALITLNRPERHNAICRDLLVRLYDAIDEVAHNDAIKAAIITGNGKSFCSGLDLEVVGKENLLDPRGDGRDMPDVFSACKKPIIGAVNGNAITGGFELALNCDFLIASENARFIDSHAKVGIHPGWGMTQLLQQAVGQRMAKQMSFTCRPLSARDALLHGLVNEVVAAEELIPRAKQIARDISEVNFEIMLEIKALIEKQNEVSLEQSLKIERQRFQGFLKRAKLLF